MHAHPTCIYMHDFSPSILFHQNYILHIQTFIHDTGGGGGGSCLLLHVWGGGGGGGGGGESDV